MDPDAVTAMGREALESERRALELAESRLGAEFAEAVGLVCGCKGRVVVTGIGKSGHIGAKLAATLSSLGTPACFLHAAEAVHGDLGLVGPEDVIIAISNSGETAELVRVLEAPAVGGNPVIALTGAPGSTLGRMARVVLHAGVEREADHLGLAPTSSATAALALGDALAVAAARVKGFRREDFQKFHPGGSLGRSLRGEK